MLVFTAFISELAGDAVNFIKIQKNPNIRI